MNKFFGFAIVAFVGVAIYWQQKPKTYPPGVLIETEPRQTEFVGTSAPLQKAGFDIKPLAHFELEARVLHKKRYWSDAVAKLAPIDLAVGWGPMSDQQVLDHLEISQSNRFFFWEYQNPPPLPTDQIICHATNMHLIPSSDETLGRIQSTRAGDLIHLRGLLIEASAPGMPPWRSSLTRTDTGKGACEIVWVESFEKL